MKKKFRANGYSSETVWKNLDKNLPIYSLSTDLTPQYEWQNGKPTDKVIGYRAGFTQEGAEYFEVKFPKQITLPKYMSIVSFEGLEAFETRYDVYFKATDVKEVK